VSEPHDCSSDYMGWYTRMSHPYLIPGFNSNAVGRCRRRSPEPEVVGPSRSSSQQDRGHIVRYLTTLVFHCYFCNFCNL